MDLMRLCVTVLMLSAHLVLSLAPVTYRTGGRVCRMCPAGQYQKSCSECEACPEGSYTTELNREESCYPCFGDCSAEFHLQVVKNCSRTSDLECRCESGFRCTDTSPLSANCRQCEKIQDRTRTTTGTRTTTRTTTVKPVGDQQTSSSASKRCSFPQCRPPSGPAAENSTQDDSGRLLAAILCPVVVMSCVAVVILFCVRRPGDETYFRQTVAKLCSEGGQNSAHKSKESPHQFGRDSFGVKQQSSSVSAANLGSVHVHNPGTVIFSLLSQFTGQVGPTAEGAKAERSSEEPFGGCPVFHPSSPHISEEERSHEADSIFFPSQEQGKDFHVSKEEAL